MKKKHLLAAALATLVVAAVPARADTVWNWSYASGDVSASGQWDTAGNAFSPEDLLWITGSYSDSHVANGSITGLVPLGTDGAWIYDNQFGGPGLLSNPGVLFDVDHGAVHVNLYSDNGAFVSGTDWRGQGYALTSVSSVVVSAVPEPGGLAMLLAGIGVVGLMAHRKRQG